MEYIEKYKYSLELLKHISKYRDNINKDFKRNNNITKTEKLFYKLLLYLISEPTNYEKKFQKKININGFDKDELISLCYYYKVDIFISGNEALFTLYVNDIIWFNKIKKEENKKMKKLKKEI